MLTPRQNFMQVHKGGNPDRFVKQFEFFAIVPDPGMFGARPEPGGEAVDAWGVTSRWPEGVITPFPVHDDEHKVVKDIKRWREYIKAPSLDYTEEAWEEPMRIASSIDRNELFVGTIIFPGFFEHLHYMMGMNDALMNLVLEPEETHAIIDNYLQYLLKRSDIISAHTKPDMLMLSDDLGTSRNSFISPEMFREFFLPAYKKLFARWRDNGAELIYMHNDSYSANLVPLFIEAGIDVWQGATTLCDVAHLVKEYGGQITIMGDIDSGVVDQPNWTRELVEAEVRRACSSNGKLYFVPSMTMAAPPTLYPGVDSCIDECIDMMSKEMF
ncbi:MAG: uroporphyrinogen decarboxylase [Eubacteriaceae bacterium]|nr:uroporphyrinogen decarboxylase [Eubacteriaceae bacterium]